MTVVTRNLSCLVVFVSFSSVKKLKENYNSNICWFGSCDKRKEIKSNCNEIFKQRGNALFTLVVEKNSARDAS